MPHPFPTLRPSNRPRPLTLHAAPEPTRVAQRNPAALTAARAAELRRRLRDGEFDTPRHAQALACVLLDQRVLDG